MQAGCLAARGIYILNTDWVQRRSFGPFHLTKPKLIKAIKQNILWTIARYEGALVHCIGVYLATGDKPEATYLMRVLNWILYSIFFIDPVPNIIVTGDFNKDGINMSEFLLTTTS